MREKLFTVQASRAVAALLVVFFHVTQYINIYYKESFLGDFFKFGYCGVDFFFVLSGFIISFTSYHLIDSRDLNKMTGFLKKRFARVYPIYWIYLLGMLVLFIFLPQLNLNNDGFHLASLINTFLLGFNHNAIITTSWSLSYEIYFYILFSLSIFSKKFIRLFQFILVVSLVNMICQYAANYYIFGKTSLIERCFSPFNLEFLLGVLIYRFRGLLNKNMAVTCLIAGAMLMLFSGTILENMHLHKSLDKFRVITYGIPSFMFLLGLVRLEALVRIRVPMFLVLLGDASYTLYLVHRATLSALNKIVIDKLHLVFINFTITNILFIVAVTALSIGLYKFLEKPLYSWVNRVIGNKPGGKSKNAISTANVEAPQASIYEQQ